MALIQEVQDCNSDEGESNNNIPFAQVTVLSDEYEHRQIDATATAAATATVPTRAHSNYYVHNNSNNNARNLQQDLRCSEITAFNDDDNHHHHHHHPVVASGIAMGLMVSMLGASPTISLSVYMAATYCCYYDEGLMGDISRAMGEIALVAQEKVNDIEQKHRIVERTYHEATNYLSSIFFFD